jgi:hypothetical protein
MFARADVRVASAGCAGGARLARALPALVLFGVTVLSSGVANAQYAIETGHAYGELETPRTTAVAGAIASTSSSTSAIFANPANMAIAQVYHFGAMAQIFPEAGRQTFGGAVVDSLLSSTGLSGGLSFAWTQQDPGGLGRQWTDLRFGLALPIPDVLYVGVVGRYMQADQTGVGPLGYSKASGGLDGRLLIETITIDVGATLRPIPELVVSLVGHNLTSPDTSLIPLMGVASVGFLTGEFSLAADLVLEATTFQATKFRAQGGGEFLSVTGTDSTVINFGFTVHMESLGLGAVSTED